MTLDKTDRTILNRLQDGLPITSEPFAALATELAIDTSDLLTRLDRMKEARIVTRFGPFFDAAAMGGAFCLCAMEVPQEKFETVMTKVNSLPEVAHNYERSHRLNMWFVLATETKEDIEAVAMSLERETGLRVLRFPKLKEFFIGFKVAT